MDKEQRRDRYNQHARILERALWSGVSLAYLAFSVSFAKGAIDVYQGENRLERAAVIVDVDQARRLELWGALGAAGTLLASGLATAGAIYTPLNELAADEEQE